MYQSLFFLVAVLLLVNVAPEAVVPLISMDPGAALLLSIALFTVVLFACRRLDEGKSSGLLVLFLLGHHFVWMGHRAYLPLLEVSSAVFGALSLTLYFGGLAVHHRALGKRNGLLPKPVQFLLPFAIPFITFQALFDLLRAIPYAPFQDILQGASDPLLSAVVWVGITGTFLVSIMMFLPPLLAWAWDCEPLPQSELRARLERLCQRLGFRYAGLRVWKVLASGTTAAVIGGYSRLRYIIFTPRLLNDVPAEQIEAILVHEIGHTRHRHLWLYPLVVLGLLVLSAIVSYFLIEPMLAWVSLRALLTPDSLWPAANVFVLLIPLGALTLGYFRLVFGYFSRNFERQADLHIFEVGLPAIHLIDALNTVAAANGIDPDEKNWHHYGIRDRTRFLESALADPSVVSAHHRRVRRILTGYVLLLTLGFTWLAGTQLQWEPISVATDKLQSQVISSLTQSTRYTLADRYSLTEIGHQVLVDSYLFQAGDVPGVGEFYAAQQLQQIGLWPDSAQLMIAAWKLFDFSAVAPAVRIEFVTTTNSLLEQVPESKETRDLARELQRLSQ